MTYCFWGIGCDKHLVTLYHLIYLHDKEITANNREVFKNVSSTVNCIRLTSLWSLYNSCIHAEVQIINCVCSRTIFKTCSEYDQYTCLMTTTKPISFLFAYCYMSTLKGVLLDACLFLWKSLVTFRIAPSCTMRQARRAVLRASHRPECSRPSNCRPSSESACWRPCGRLM